MSKYIKWQYLLFALFLFFLPLLVVKSHIYFFSRKTTVDSLQPVDAVVVLGTIVRNGTISPLMKERLESGITLIESGIAKKIVVSNTKDASIVMRAYLINCGIDESLIELDSSAIRTVDTCIHEQERHPEKRSLIYISQDYHLPRVAFQCWRKEVSGIVFPADSLRVANSNTPFLTLLKIRSWRHIREAGLMWGTVLRN